VTSRGNGSDNQAISALADPALAEHVTAIRTLGKQTVSNVIEIGGRLKRCKDIIGPGNWLSFLEREFGWTDDTALNFMRIHELSKSRNFRDLSLPISSLYLLAKPSTSDEARDAVLELATNGETLTHAQVKQTINAAKGRGQSAKTASRHAIYREMKLGADVMAKIAGTSLDSAREMDELIILDRGAPEGGHTPIVERLVADAAAGKDVSAVDHTAPYRRTRKNSRNDIGPTGAGEVARLQAQVDELEVEKRRLESENVGLRSEIEKLKARLAAVTTPTPHPPETEHGRIPATPASCSPHRRRGRRPPRHPKPSGPLITEVSA
jgi:Protein of unknown function (DUF3102)